MVGDASPPLTKWGGGYYTPDKHGIHSDKQYSRQEHIKRKTLPSILGFISELLTSVCQAVNALYDRLRPDLQLLQTRSLPGCNRSTVQRYLRRFYVQIL